jgi:hypothetical protein
MPNDQYKNIKQDHDTEYSFTSQVEHICTEFFDKIPKIIVTMHFSGEVNIINVNDAT